MENLKEKQNDKKPVFTFENLQKSIKTLNKLTEKKAKGDSISKEESEKDEKKLKSCVEYIKNYSESFSKSDHKNIITFLNELLTISQNSFKSMGDELTEGLWKLYDARGFTIHNSDVAFTYYEFFLNLFFLNNKNLLTLIKNEILEINKESRKIESNFTLDKLEEVKSKLDFGKEEDHAHLIEKKNFLIDMIIILILVNSDIRGFYTSLSSFLVTNSGNVMLLFKTLSLFALCLWQFEKVENSLGGLLYIIGGVLRDHGRSYLKTKGILNENLSYHHCKKKGSHENQFFNPVILTTKECDYLELYFLQIMKEFIKTIISHLKFEKFALRAYWDDYLPVFYKYLEWDEMDHNDTFPAEVEIFHFLNLFLSDFLFFFITNFCDYSTETKTFSTNFSILDDFLNYSFTVIWNSCRNINNLFEISERKRKFFEVECEKTEYSMKDFPNHYGICLSFYLMFWGRYNPVNILNEKDFVLESSFLPLVVNKKYYFSLFQSALYTILRNENLSEFRFLKDYQNFSWDMFENMVRVLTEPNEVIFIKNNKLLVYILYEFSKLDKIRYEPLVETIKSISDVGVLPEEILRLTNRENEILKILKILQKLFSNLSNPYLPVNNLFSILKVLTFNSTILNSEIRTALFDFVPKNELSELLILIKHFLSELNSYDSKEHGESKLKNLDLFFKYKKEIIDTLENLLL